MECDGDAITSSWHHTLQYVIYNILSCQDDVAVWSETLMRCWLVLLAKKLCQNNWHSRGKHSWNESFRDFNHSKTIHDDDGTWLPKEDSFVCEIFLFRHPFFSFWAGTVINSSRKLRHSAAINTQDVDIFFLLIFAPTVPHWLIVPRFTCIFFFLVIAEEKHLSVSEVQARQLSTNGAPLEIT